jgi:hypothetical protein
VEFFIYRCELAREYWRSEFDSLMGARMELWAGGLDQQKVCDILQIPKASLAWIDTQIRQFVWFPSRARLISLEYLALRRKMKAGVAADIIRRKQKGYKQTQSLQPQQHKPSEPKDGLYMREDLHAPPKGESHEEDNQI